MSGHGFYLWMAYGATALALLAELLVLRLRRARALKLVEQERDLEAQD
jgi:heme exporter protein CcmD